MPPIYLYNGKILVRNSQIAANSNCCCQPTPTVSITPTITPGDQGCDCETTMNTICRDDLDITINGLFYNDNGQINPLNINLNIPGHANGFYPVGVGQLGDVISVSVDKGYTCYLEVEGEDIVQKLRLDVTVGVGGNWFCDQNGNNQVNGPINFRTIINFNDLPCLEEMNPIAIADGQYQLNIVNDPCGGNLNGNTTWTMHQFGFGDC